MDKGNQDFSEQYKNNSALLILSGLMKISFESNLSIFYLSTMKILQLISCSEKKEDCTFALSAFLMMIVRIVGNHQFAGRIMEKSIKRLWKKVCYRFRFTLDALIEIVL